MKRIERPYALRCIHTVFALVAVTAVAACEDGSAPTATASTSQTAPAATSENTPNTQAATADDQITISKCNAPVGDKVYFQVGTARLGVPGTAIVDAIPSSLQSPRSKEEVTQELKKQAANGSGCPERPIDAVLLVVNDKFDHPLLEGTAGLVRASPGITERFAELTRNLQNKPTKNCKPLNGQLLACVGTETRGTLETPVMYVITTDRSKNLNTGGPLAARCVLKEKTVQGCNLIDKLPGGMTIDVTLNAGTYTTADLAGARNAALKRIGSYTN